MYAAAYPSDAGQPATACDPLAPVRARGAIHLTAAGDGTHTRIVDLEERGGYRCKFPDTPVPWLEAVIVNTGGGVAGGDHIDFKVETKDQACLRIGTATAERIYRSLGNPTTITGSFRVADQSTLVWSPQPTIAFSGSRLDRKYEVDVVARGTFLIAETICFGRRDSGEHMGPGSYRDRWRIHRSGKLVHAEITALDGEIGAALARPAVLAGAGIAATVVCVAHDIEDHLDKVRDLLAESAGTAAAGCRAGLLIVRAVGNRLEHLERTISSVCAYLTARGTASKHQAGTKVS